MNTVDAAPAPAPPAPAWTRVGSSWVGAAAIAAGSVAAYAGFREAVFTGLMAAIGPLSHAVAQDAESNAVVVRAAIGAANAAHAFGLMAAATAARWLKFWLWAQPDSPAETVATWVAIFAWLGVAGQIVSWVWLG